MAAGPIHQSMLILDVEGSGSRTDPEKQAVRRTLYQLVMAAFAYRWVIAEPNVPEQPVPRRRQAARASAGARARR